MMLNEISVNEISQLYAHIDLPEQDNPPVQNELIVVQEGSFWLKLYHSLFGSKTD